MTVAGFDQVVEQNHLALDAFARRASPKARDPLEPDGLPVPIERGGQLHGVHNLVESMNEGAERVPERHVILRGPETRAVHGSSCIATQTQSRPLGPQTR
jgi:hypothetical protein